jgi:XTP/dITP diphosphohydrolase
MGREAREARRRERRERRERRAPGADAQAGLRVRSTAAALTLVLATRNAGKVAEMQALLEGLGVELVAAGDLGAPDVEETADTLEGNALLKARALHAFTGRPALADDTGLEVAALGGAPGVHSARYAGPEGDAAANRAKLLASLDGSPDRWARFRTVLAYVDAGEEHLFEGTCAGRILTEERGAGGFGYDALFVPDGSTVTFAEMTPAAKNGVSHRGRALQGFVAWLRGKRVAGSGRM